jgi:DNA-binding SARP family transcriptional activator
MAIVVNEQRLPGFPTKKAQSLFAYLLTTRGCRHPRTVLAEKFWPGRPESEGRKNLRTAIWRIKKVLEYGPASANGLLDIGVSEVGIPSGACWLDIEEFERCAHPAVALAAADWDERDRDSVERAVKLYRGDLLEDLYDDWVVYERERLRELFCRAMEALITRYVVQERWADAVAAAQRLLSMDPLREPVHRQLMHCCCMQGDKPAAVKHYVRFRNMLWDELGVDPMPETCELYLRIRDAGRQPESPAKPSDAAMGF